MDGHHVGVVDPGERACFAQDARTQGPGPLDVVLGQRGVRRAYLLERHVTVEGQVAGAPDRTHTAAAQPLHQLEAAVDHSAHSHPCTRVPAAVAARCPVPPTSPYTFTW